MSQTKINRPRGTQDLLPATNLVFRKIETLARNLADQYGYGEIQTPIFEFSEVFHRTLGETSDVIHKETYTFQDRGEESLTLRPEGTAGIARSFILEGMAQNLPLKFFYSGPMFRYERPQKGRYRQFHQVGIECLGQEHPLADVECLSLGWELMKKLELQNDVLLEINTLGDTESRILYKQKLVDYYQNYKPELSTDSQIRLEKNPLRILDSKDETDRKINSTAPRFDDLLNLNSKKFFNDVQTGLTKLNIPFQLNSKLVRGLDYYCHTVFEFTTQKLGAQGAVLAGGRYDGLIEMMGGAKTPGVGWAAGLERMIELVPENFKPVHQTQVVIIPADDTGTEASPQLAMHFRSKGLRTEILFAGNVGKKMKKADAMGATYAVIAGSTELSTNSVNLKNLKTGEQKLILISELANTKL